MGEDAGPLSLVLRRRCLIDVYETRGDVFSRMLRQRRRYSEVGIQMYKNTKTKYGKLDLAEAESGALPKIFDSK